MEEKCSLRCWGSEGEEEEAKGEERKAKAIQLVPIRRPLLAHAWMTPAWPPWAQPRLLLPSQVVPAEAPATRGNKEEHGFGSSPVSLPQTTHFVTVVLTAMEIQRATANGTLLRHSDLLGQRRAEKAMAVHVQKNPTNKQTKNQQNHNVNPFKCIWWRVGMGKGFCGLRCSNVCQEEHQQRS